MEDPKLLNSLVKIFECGITSSNFTLAATLVYTAITKTSPPNTHVDEIAERCEFVLLYVIDNTDSEIDTRNMVPIMIQSLVKPAHPVGFFKRCFGCSSPPQPQEPPRDPPGTPKTAEPQDLPKAQHPRVKQIKFDAIH